MINNKNISKITFYFLSAILLVSSCRKNEKAGYDHFVSDNFVVTFSTASINSFLDLAGQTYPEVNGFKPFITHDVNVYKMVYKTKVNNEDIEASGLVCVPVTEGTYPVLSFQNGTNTIYGNAPSENPSNQVYELIEFMSSMGFIVVIPDYPGFGESTQIPHPYLIEEPTIQSVVDMLRAVRESCPSEFKGITAKNEYYLLGYSQGGWATLALHKALETEYQDEFKLAGSSCGAGPYNMYNMFLGMIGAAIYPMPSYLGYIIYAYARYHEFTNPVSDLLNEPYASRLGSLYTGTLTLDQINSQLTTSIPGLFKPDFISGFASSPSYSSVRAALTNNSIAAWKSSVPLLFVHGQADSDVSVTSTETMYQAMIEKGTSPDICKKILFPGLDHGDALLPGMSAGLLFLLDIRDNRN